MKRQKSGDRRGHWRPAYLLGTSLRDEIDEEIAFHIETQTRALVEAGMSEAEARVEAERMFGRRAAIERQLLRIGRAREREARWGGRVVGLLRDLQLAVRSLRRSPGFALTALASLGLGIGATLTVFTLVNSILLDPLPYPHADRLVAVGHAAPGLNLPRAGLSDGTFHHYRAHNHVFEEIGTWYENVVNLSGGEDADAERVPAAIVSSDFFSVFSAKTVVGRLPTGEDARRPVADVVVLLSYDLWRRRYGADPGIVGRTVLVSGERDRVIGVLEPGFDFPRREIGLWYPSEVSPEAVRFSGLDESAVARLKPGITPAEAEADLNRLIPSLPDVLPDVTPQTLEQARLRATVVPLKELVVGNVARGLSLLLAAVGLLLLLGCANVANLFLIRAEHRHKEIAVRTALGARAAEIRRLFVAESVMVAAFGGALGLVIAWVAIRILVAHGPADLPRLQTVAIDGRVLALALLLVLVCAAVCAVTSFAASRRPGLSSALAEGARGATAGRHRQAVRRVLVAGQMAIALTLVSGAALVLQSFWHLAHADPGFDGRDVLTAEVALPYIGYEDYPRAYAFWDGLLGRVRALPGVEAAGAVTALPLVPAEPYYGFELSIQGATDDDRPTVWLYTVTPGYFETMHIPVRRGQLPWGEKTSVPDRPVVVSEALATRVLGSPEPLGLHLRRRTRSGLPWSTVAAVVGDVPSGAIGGQPAEILYVPVLARPVDRSFVPARMTLVMRTSVPPVSLAPAVRGIMREMDPDVPLANVRTMQSIVGNSMERVTFGMTLMIVAAVSALLLGLVGLYGVVSYAVARRAREFGVRIAVGARPSDLGRLVLAEAATLALAGALLGSAAALGTGKLLSGLLFGVSPTDPATIAAAAGLLTLTALFTSWLPARRAAAVDPLRALAEE